MTRPKIKIKKGDTVIVHTGADKGKISEVIKVYPYESRLLIKDVNIVKRHIRPSTNQPGSIEFKEKTIHISNVSFYSEGKPTKISYLTDENGQKKEFQDIPVRLFEDDNATII